MEIMLVIVSLIFIGYISKYIGILREEDRSVLNNIVVYISMPSTVFLTILKNLSPRELPLFIKLSILIFVIFSLCGVIGYILGRCLKLDRRSIGGLILVCALGNTGFLGYPVIYGFYGDPGLVRAIFCDMGSVIASLLIGTFVGVTFGERKSDNTFLYIIGELLRFPPFIACMLSIVSVILGIGIEDIPNFLVDTLSYLSKATVPLIMISLGLSLSPASAKFTIKYGILALLVRLGVAPLLALILSNLFSIEGLERKVLILQSAMPSAMMSLVFSLLYKLDVKLVASACFITTIASLIILPILKKVLTL
ncbi:MAG TPA: transporter [Methanothermococcus okinawensis]|uniref:Transporter n=1 Tax=Methanothermococcus okinawensis TaxID=155863 RepID=A0A833E094_9EURY|nr:transporter [Methanothermococcus okinawensis]HIP90866.1 transporter [Methanothermococcus okinawensis]